FGRVGTKLRDVESGLEGSQLNLISPQLVLTPNPRSAWRGVSPSQRQECFERRCLPHNTERHLSHFVDAVPGADWLRQPPDGAAIILRRR
ncbi:hypothetical protein BaRGS_00029430, partial [Batillaria attramentaria]